MRNVMLALCLWVMSSLALPAAAASLNLAGGTGLIKTPTALTLEDGEFAVGFSWIGGPRGYLYQPKTNRHYFASLSVLPGLELTLDQLQVVGWYPGDAPGVAYGFHRMWNVKYQIPLPESWPRVAVGAQDPLGANFIARGSAGKTEYGLNTFYGVLSQPLGPLALHLGYGDSPRFIKGVFVGADWEAGAGFNLRAEFDSREWNAGICWRPVSWFGLQAARLFPDDWAYSAVISLSL